jgi:hypothetical protein
VNQTPSLKQKADSYLLHIALAVRVGDNGHVFRDFLDNWAAFRSGGVHVSSGERPRWLNNPKPWAKVSAAVHEMDWVSRDAAVILARGKAQDQELKLSRASDDEDTRNRFRLIVDHAVPLSALCKRLHSERIATPRKVEAFLLDWFRRGVITYAEDRRLNERGLNKKMPREDWWNDSPFARYREAGIAPADHCRY